MKVILVGPPGSGKSTWLGAAYRASRWNSETARLRLRGADTATHKVLGLLGRGQKNASGAKRYRVHLFNGNKSVGKMEIVDHPGAALLPQGGQRITRGLFADVLDADLIVFVVDVRSLLEPAPGADDVAEATGLSLLRVLLDRRAAPPRVVLLLTHLDQCPPWLAMPGADSLTSRFDRLVAAANGGITVLARPDDGAELTLPLLWGLSGDSTIKDARSTSTLREFLDAKLVSASAKSTGWVWPVSSPDRRQAMNSLPTITVTLLGISKSGKTTYLTAMLGTLVRSVVGYSIVVGGGMGEAHRAHLKLLDDWDDLAEGRLPAPTDEQPQQHKLVFCRGVDPLLEIDWMDYRGGALAKGQDDTADTQMVLNRLVRSDCVFLVLDGQYLVKPVDKRNELKVVRKLRVDLLESLLRKAIVIRKQQSQPPPAVVVMITKADLMADGDAAAFTADQIEARLVDDMRRLVPVAFSPGVAAMVGAVSIGHLGGGEVSEVRAELISPRRLHVPLIFTLFARHWTSAAQHELNVVDMQQDRDEAMSKRDDLAASGKGFGDWMEKAWLSWQIRSSERRERRQVYEHISKKSEADKIIDELKAFPIFIGGERVQ